MAEKLTWHRRNPQAAREARKRSYYKHHARMKDEMYDRWIQKRYGITIKDYKQLEMAQGGRCAICGGPPSGRGRLHLDHNHSTGRIRGLLCSTCNVGIGGLRDSTDLLMAAVEYLKKHGVAGQTQCGKTDTGGTLSGVLPSVPSPRQMVYDCACL
jgi:hypothetical protein